MAKIDENKAYDLITHYYDSEALKVSTLDTFLTILEGDIADERALTRVGLTDAEITSEAILALLETFQEVMDNGHGRGWKQSFLKRFRGMLAPHRRRNRHFVDITGLAIEDANPNPEELYIVKELVHLIRLHIHNNFDLMSCDWFMRRYANGERAQDIADDYGVTVRAVNKKLYKMLPKVKKYMERING